MCVPTHHSSLITHHALWISHRGYKVHAVENSLKAFQAAIAIGFTALETDLRMTKDNQIVLLHDQSLYRLLGDHRKVAHLSRKALSQIRLSGGEPVLFLDQFIESFPNQHWLFDIKPESGNQTVDALTLWFKKNDWGYRFVDQVKFLFWRDCQERRLKQSFPQVNCYVQKNACIRAGMSALLRIPSLGGIRSGHTYALPPGFGAINMFDASLIKPFHDRGAKVIAFLPRNDQEALAAVKAGFDEILTNGRMLG